MNKKQQQMNEKHKGKESKLIFRRSREWKYMKEFKEIETK